MICLPRLYTIACRCCTIPACENARRSVLLQDCLISWETFAELIRDFCVLSHYLNVIDSLLFRLFLVGVFLKFGGPIRLRVPQLPNGRRFHLLPFQKCRTFLWLLDCQFLWLLDACIWLSEAWLSSTTWASRNRLSLPWTSRWHCWNILSLGQMGSWLSLGAYIRVCSFTRSLWSAPSPIRRTIVGSTNLPFHVHDWDEVADGRWFGLFIGTLNTAREHGVRSLPRNLRKSVTECWIINSIEGSLRALIIINHVTKLVGFTGNELALNQDLCRFHLPVLPIF